jgi:hypothetical protein
LLPDALSGDAGRELRQAIQILANTEIKNNSGSAVSGNEMTRNLKALGNSKLATEKQIMDGIKALRLKFDAEKQNLIAGHDAETLSKYEEQGGIKFSRGAQPPKLSAKKDGGAAAQNGGYAGHSEDEIAATMKQYGKTRDEVLQAIDRKKSKAGAI